MYRSHSSHEIICNSLVVNQTNTHALCRVVMILVLNPAYPNTRDKPSH